MLVKILSSSILGLEPQLIEVEVDMSQRGMPSLSIIGLAGKDIDESRYRVKTAILNSNLNWPQQKFTVNLAPSDFPKEGTHFDLPIAVGILVSSGQIEAHKINKSLFLGEVSLNGEIRKVNGVLAMLFLLDEIKDIENVFLPAENAKEAGVIADLLQKKQKRIINVFALESIEQLVGHCLGIKNLPAFKNIDAFYESNQEQYEIDFSDIRGQEHAKRGLEIAAAGAHNVRMEGVPGAGKTMLAKALPSILPKMTLQESLEVTKIYSLNGLLPRDKPLINIRPFRNPHHTISQIGLVGGGTKPRPGEISLAHRGILFLDEFPQFPQYCLETLRAPLEDGSVTISRAHSSLRFPAKFTLIAAQNPCPCGFWGSSEKRCTCPPYQLIKYQRRISGPLLDRIDIHLHVPQVRWQKLTEENYRGENSKQIRERVQTAREKQLHRFRGTNLTTNSEMSTRDIKKYCPLNSECLSLLRQAVIKMQLSARSYFRLIKISRSIADLAQEEQITKNHLAEALTFRQQGVGN